MGADRPGRETEKTVGLKKPFGGAAALIVFAGIALIAESIRNLHTIHCISDAVRSGRKDDVIEVSWKSAD